MCNKTTGRCPNCDDTGDVHRADGEWLGECNCRKSAGHPDQLAELLAFFVNRAAPIQSKFDLYGPRDTADALREKFKEGREALAAYGHWEQL